jgi:transposase
MARGPAIKMEEIKKAHELKAEGHKPPQIAAKMQRSVPTIYKMLSALPPTEFEAVENK